MSDFQSKLAEAQETWSESEKTAQQGFTGEHIPAGVYDFQMQSCYIHETDENQYLRIAREHLILEGQYQGRVAYDGLMPGNAIGASNIRRWLQKLGITPPAKVEELEEIVLKVNRAAPTYRGRLSYKNNFAKVVIREMIDFHGLGETPTAAKTASEPTLEERMRAFCGAWDLKVKDSDSLEAMRKKIAKVKFPKESCDEDDAALLTELGLEGRIQG